MPERLASFAPCEADGWLLLALALASRLAFFRLADGHLERLHAVEPELATRSDHGACDRQGRFVFGTLHEPHQGDKQPVGGFCRLDASLQLGRLDFPCAAISHAIAFIPDGDTMYFCASLTRRIDCCDDADSLGAPRVFTTL